MLCFHVHVHKHRQYFNWYIVLDHSQWTISAMTFSDDFVMSQNKMDVLMWDFVQGTHWERW